jgi:hypothetical protein
MASPQHPDSEKNQGRPDEVPPRDFLIKQQPTGKHDKDEDNGGEGIGVGERIVFERLLPHYGPYYQQRCARIYEPVGYYGCYRYVNSDRNPFEQGLIQGSQQDGRNYIEEW